MIKDIIRDLEDLKTKVESLVARSEEVTDISNSFATAGLDEASGLVDELDNASTLLESESLDLEETLAEMLEEYNETLSKQESLPLTPEDVGEDQPAE